MLVKHRNVEMLYVLDVPILSDEIQSFCNGENANMLGDGIWNV